MVVLQNLVFKQCLVLFSRTRSFAHEFVEMDGRGSVTGKITRA